MTLTLVLAWWMLVPAVWTAIFIAWMWIVCETVEDIGILCIPWVIGLILVSLVRALS